MFCLKTFQRHDWPKWETTHEAEVTKRQFNDPQQETGVVGRVIYQSRTCTRCGRTDLRASRAQL